MDLSRKYLNTIFEKKNDLENEKDRIYAPMNSLWSFVLPNHKYSQAQPEFFQELCISNSLDDNLVSQQEQAVAWANSLQTYVGLISNAFQADPATFSTLFTEAQRQNTDPLFTIPPFLHDLTSHFIQIPSLHSMWLPVFGYPSSQVTLPLRLPSTITNPSSLPTYSGLLSDFEAQLPFLPTEFSGSLLNAGQPVASLDFARIDELSDPTDPHYLAVGTRSCTHHALFSWNTPTTEGPTHMTIPCQQNSGVIELWDCGSLSSNSTFGDLVIDPPDDSIDKYEFLPFEENSFPTPSRTERFPLQGPSFSTLPYYSLGIMHQFGCCFQLKWNPQVCADGFHAWLNWKNKEQTQPTNLFLPRLGILACSCVGGIFVCGVPHPRALTLTHDSATVTSATALSLNALPHIILSLPFEVMGIDIDWSPSTSTVHLLAVACSDGILRLFNTDSPAGSVVSPYMSLPLSKYPLRHVQFCPSKPRFLITAGSESVLHLVDMNNPVACVAPQQRTAKIRVGDDTEGKNVQAPLTHPIISLSKIALGVRNWLTSVHWMTNGKIVMGFEDNTVRVITERSGWESLLQKDLKSDSSCVMMKDFDTPLPEQTIFKTTQPALLISHIHEFFGSPVLTISHSPFSSLMIAGSSDGHCVVFGRHQERKTGELAALEVTVHDIMDSTAEREVLLQNDLLKQLLDQHKFVTPYAFSVSQNVPAVLVYPSHYLLTTLITILKDNSYFNVMHSPLISHTQNTVIIRTLTATRTEPTPAMPILSSLTAKMTSKKTSTKPKPVAPPTPEGSPSPSDKAALPLDPSSQIRDDTTPTETVTSPKPRRTIIPDSDDSEEDIPPTFSTTFDEGEKREKIDKLLQQQTQPQHQAELVPHLSYIHRVITRKLTSLPPRHFAINSVIWNKSGTKAGNWCAIGFESGIIRLVRIQDVTDDFIQQPTAT